MRRSLRANQYLRMIQNEFVTTESSFINMSAWDRCVDPRIGSVAADRSLGIFVGVDASVKHDSTAIVAVTWDRKGQRCRLVFHRVFQPTPEEPLNFEFTIERTLLDLNRRFRIRAVWYDPWQMQSVAQRLARAGIKLVEFPQTPANLTAASQNLFEVIQGQNIVGYYDAGLRMALSRTIAIETPRGWRIGKDKQVHKIDVVVALAMACYAAVSSQGEYDYNLEAMC
jgi:phage terminase large subunit-like protein